MAKTERQIRIGSVTVRIDRKLEKLFESQELPIDPLMSQVIKDGRFHTKLVVWEEEGLLLDGHRRVKCWEAIKRKGTRGVKAPEVTKLSFDDRAEAIRWMKKNQIARRNLSQFQIDAIRAEEVAALTATGVSHTKAAREVASNENVDERTIRRSVETGNALDKIREVDEQFADDVNSGEVEVAATNVKKMSKLTPAQMRKVIAGLRKTPGAFRDLYEEARKADESSQTRGRRSAEKATRSQASVDAQDDDRLRSKLQDAIGRMVRTIEEVAQAKGLGKTPRMLSARQTFDDFLSIMKEVTGWPLE